MAMRTVSSRLRSLGHALRVSGTLQPRAFSSRVLSDEERAAENVYIKKMEKEKLEKRLATEGGKAETHVSSSSPAYERPPVSDTSSDPTKNIAVAAGLVAIVASGWWFYRANKQVFVVDDE
ncbi:hypothetical protein KP509_31G005800 [Ceratopteris richardii]|uniref:Uncharacterized protein n=1 Tax=Ceratopteris richardii TaxID=49495 RepID=A0A8T2QVH3_CERRI|nr:hypothetical protein KP509_31G005800 [Ceratopteris richardii]